MTDKKRKADKVNSIREEIRKIKDVLGRLIPKIDEDFQKSKKEISILKDDVYEKMLDLSNRTEEQIVNQRESQAGEIREWAVRINERFNESEKRIKRLELAHIIELMIAIVLLIILVVIKG